MAMVSTPHPRTSLPHQDGDGKVFWVGDGMIAVDTDDIGPYGPDYQIQIPKKCPNRGEEIGVFVGVREKVTPIDHPQSLIEMKKPIKLCQLTMVWLQQRPPYHMSQISRMREDGGTSRW